MKEFFTNAWEQIVSIYAAYTDFIHSIFRDELGDYIILLINLAVAVFLIWLIAKAAFRTRGN